MKIYTRKGDDGTTSLFGGRRVLKCEELVEAYGTIDELNSWIGLLISAEKTWQPARFLITIQNDLFVIGSILAGWQTSPTGWTGRINEMEREIDDMESRLPEIRNFILPGGSIKSSQVQIARSIARRAERQVVWLIKSKTAVSVGTAVVTRNVIAYLNRLSDYLFILARWENKAAKYPEKIWKGRVRA